MCHVKPREGSPANAVSPWLPCQTPSDPDPFLCRCRQGVKIYLHCFGICTSRESPSYHSCVPSHQSQLGCLLCHRHKIHGFTKIWGPNVFALVHEWIWADLAVFRDFRSCSARKNWSAGFLCYSGLLSAVFPVRLSVAQTPHFQA